MNEKDLFYLLGFVKISKYRLETLKSLENSMKTPSEISREINTRTSQVSQALSDLKRKDLVVCINDEVTKGRLYKCTPSGLEVLEYI